MKVLLIGGKGFIGKNLILHLKERKINYLTFDKNKLKDRYYHKSCWNFSTL
jgi:nucleoside-diphosphate-sugar epimerase